MCFNHRTLICSECNTERPKCGQFLGRNTPCEYEDTQKQAAHQKYEHLRKQQIAYEELLNQLIALPENESLNVFRRIRAGNHAGLLPFLPPPSHIDRDTSEANIGEVLNNALKQKHEQLEQQSRNTTELYRLLQHAPENGADELLGRIRHGMSPDHVPAFTGQLLSCRSPSPNQTNRSMMPPTDTSVEFELVSLHPNVYPSLSPLDVASLNLGLLGISSLRSFRRNRPNSPSKINNMSIPHTTSTLSSSKYIDARSGRIQMRRWSNVAISNELADRIISSYLVNDTPWWAFFNIDLFLDDFANGTNRFCSPLLVSSMLAWACVSFPATDHICLSALLTIISRLAIVCLL